LRLRRRGRKVRRSGSPRKPVEGPVGGLLRTSVSTTDDDAPDVERAQDEGWILAEDGRFEKPGELPHSLDELRTRWNRIADAHATPDSA